MDLGDITQAAAAALCTRLLPQNPGRTAICGIAAAAGHFAGDIAQAATIKKAGDVITNISKEAHERLENDNAKSGHDESTAQLLVGIGGNFIGGELGRAGCYAAGQAIFPGPVGTAIGFGCHMAASYVGGKVLVYTVEGYV